MFEMLIVPIFGWMPPVVQVVARGVAAMFFFTLALHIIQFILSLLPWK